MNDNMIPFATTIERVAFIDHSIKYWTGIDSHLAYRIQNEKMQLSAADRRLPKVLLVLNEAFSGSPILWRNLLVHLGAGPLEKSVSGESYYALYQRYVLLHGIMERHLTMIDPPVFADANTSAIMMVDNSLSAFLAKMFFCDSFFPRAKYFFRRAEEDQFDVVSRLQERLFQYPFSPMLNSSEPCWVFYGDDLVIDIADVRVTAACRSEQGCRLLDSLQLRLLPESARTW